MTWLLIAIACVAHVQRTGLVLEDAGRVVLTEQSGRETPLILAGDARAIGHLGGCTVALEGRKRGRGMEVDTWVVRDAGFGSQPFVGRLRGSGSNLYLDDRSTGTRLRLKSTGLGALREMVGGIVLIEGLVVGEHVLQVVTWRGLLAPDAESQPAG